MNKPLKSSQFFSNNFTTALVQPSDQHPKNTECDKGSGNLEKVKGFASNSYELITSIHKLISNRWSFLITRAEDFFSFFSQCDNLTICYLDKSDNSDLYLYMPLRGAFSSKTSVYPKILTLWGNFFLMPRVKLPPSIVWSFVTFQPNRIFQIKIFLLVSGNGYGVKLSRASNLNMLELWEIWNSILK